MVENLLLSIFILSQRGKRIAYIAHLKQQVTFIYRFAQIVIYKQRKLLLVGIWSGIVLLHLCMWVYGFTCLSLWCSRHHSKLSYSCTANWKRSTLRSQGVIVYTHVYTCSTVWVLYPVMVNCCQMLCCPRARRLLCCTWWLIWGGSTMCHSPTLTCWICPHGLVRKRGSLLTEGRTTSYKHNGKCEICRRLQ